MKLYKLFVHGQDIDTGRYEYFPFSDNAIKDYNRTMRVLRSLRQGVDVDKPDMKIIHSKYCVGDDEITQAAIDSAVKAVEVFKKLSLRKRFNMLLAVRDRLLRYEEDLIQLLIAEGHPASLARWEVLGMKEGLSEKSLKFFKNKMREEVGDLEGERVYWLRRADGVVCVEPPRNAPCSNSFIAVLALLPGNTLIIKPPLRQPISTIFLWREIVYPALISNGAPDGVVNIVLGNSKRILDQWLNSKHVNDIIFFGDSVKGLKIGRQIYESGKKPILELSGNDYMVVWKDANIRRAVDSLCDVFLGSSQICMVPKTALVHKSTYDDFLRGVVARLPSIKAGLPSDSETSLTPIYRLDEFFVFLKDAIDNGAILVRGGRRINYRNELDDNGGFVEPTILEVPSADVAAKLLCVREENFFPLIPVVKVSDTGSDAVAADENIFEQMVALINSDHYGLRFSLWADSDKYIRKFVSAVDNVGLFRINSRHVGFSSYLATHGGTKKSGGPFGEMNYIWQKTSHLQGVSRTKKIYLN